jgi:hypothetical protein
VNTVMAEEDPTRPQWPSNPAQGWISGVDRLTGIPNGNPLIARKGAASSAPDPSTPLALRDCSSATAARNCTLLANVDFAPGPVHTVVDAVDPAACCEACTGNATTCTFAVFFEGSCYFKVSADAAQPVWSAGRVAVWPASAGPVPPAPAPTPTGIIEQHGPCVKFRRHHHRPRTVDPNPKPSAAAHPEPPRKGISTAVDGRQ